MLGPSSRLPHLPRLRGVRCVIQPFDVTDGTAAEYAAAINEALHRHPLPLPPSGWARVTMVNGRSALPWEFSAAGSAEGYLGPAFLPGLMEAFQILLGREDPGTVRGFLSENLERAAATLRGIVARGLADIHGGRLLELAWGVLYRVPLLELGTALLCALDGTHNVLAYHLAAAMQEELDGPAQDLRGGDGRWVVVIQDDVREKTMACVFERLR